MITRITLHQIDSSPTSGNNTVAFHAACVMPVEYIVESSAPKSYWRVVLASVSMVLGSVVRSLRS